MKMYQNIVLFGVLCALIIGGHAAAIKDGEMATGINELAKKVASQNVENSSQIWIFDEEKSFATPNLEDLS